MRKIYFIYSLILFSCVLLGGYATFYLKTYNHITLNFKTSESKYDLLESANALMNNLREAESNQRGYLITNDADYLSPYNESVFRVKLDKNRFSKIASSYGLTRNNPHEIEQLNFLIDQKLREMDISIDLQKKGDNAAAVALIKSDIGVNLMKKLTATFQKLNAEQKYKETQAKQAIYGRRAKLRYLNLSVIFTLFSILIIIGFLAKDLNKPTKLD